MRDAVGSGWSLGGFARGAEQLFSGTALGQPLPGVSDATIQTRLAAAKPYTALVLRTTASYARPAHDALIWDHGHRNVALVEAGLLAVVLPVVDDSGIAGYGVFTTDLEATRRVLEGDPGGRAGIVDYELRPVRGSPGASLP